MHVNTTIRNAAAAGLATVAGIVTVSTNPGPTLLEGALPVAMVMTNPDVVGTETKGRNEPALERRTVELGVVIVADGEADSLPDVMDELREAAEVAVFAALKNIVAHVAHTGGNLDTLTDEDGERWFAFLALSWDVEVWTEQGTPGVIV